MQKKRFYIEVAVRQLFLLIFIVPVLFSYTFDSMRQMDQENQSAILAVIGLLMAAGIIGVFEATYQKTQLNHRLQRTLAHITKLLLFTGISELIILAIAAVGITSTVWDDPLLWAILPIYASLYAYDWWDALIAAPVSTPEHKPKHNLQIEPEPLSKSEIQSQS
ncbi:hypothetical protein M3I01_015720 [Marinomonas sp. RSW2]|uniref:Bacterial Transmembrane Pair family protein n=1 Tax=Marinomonas maritima TaxID=2940935 RepID=A0ABT5WJU1_9GAMM|nr:hypothetical protein [Marinomonas maritima]MDE8604320.1 hypothetical protein [Marinomonas maritima]